MTRRQAANLGAGSAAVMTERREDRANQAERRDDIDAEDVAQATVEGLGDENTSATKRETEEEE